MTKKESISKTIAKSKTKLNNSKSLKNKRSYKIEQYD